MTELQTRFTTEGLVIKEMIVGESDRLVTLFTRDYGIIRAFAAGAKNLKSKKAAATSLLTYSSFTILKKKDSYRIYEASPKAIFFTLGSDIEILSLSQYFCELAYSFGEENTPNEELLRLILNSLHFITKKLKNNELIKAITELRIASICGYSPNLIACEGCGCFEPDIVYFRFEDGSLLCGECNAEKSGIIIDKTLLSAMRHIVYSDFSKLYSFEIPPEAALRLSKITEKYITLQTDYNFHTLEFFNSIKEQI